MNKEKVTRILNEFDRMFPDAACELVHDNELELLIAVMLSAQTTDASVNSILVAAADTFSACLLYTSRCV